MKYKIIGIALGLILGLPAIVAGSSFASSLIQGKTPSEAMDALVAQLDSLNSRLNKIEANQKEEVRIEVEKTEEKKPATSMSKEEKPAPPVVNADSEVCADLKASLSSVSSSLQEKKRPLKEVKSTGLGRETPENQSMEELQQRLAQTKQQQDTLESEISVLNAKQKELTLDLKTESCSS